jgi:hypothetical protein
MRSHLNVSYEVKEANVNVYMHLTSPYAILKRPSLKTVKRSEVWRWGGEQVERRGVL